MDNHQNNVNTKPVLVDCAFALFEENIMEQAFKKQKLYAASEVRKVFYLVGQSPSLRIDDNNLDTVSTTSQRSTGHLSLIQISSQFVGFCANSLSPFCSTFSI